MLYKYKLKLILIVIDISLESTIISFSNLKENGDIKEVFDTNSLSSDNQYVFLISYTSKTKQ